MLCCTFWGDREQRLDTWNDFLLYQVCVLALSMTCIVSFGLYTYYQICTRQVKIRTIHIFGRKKMLQSKRKIILKNIASGFFSFISKISLFLYTAKTKQHFIFCPNCSTAAASDQNHCLQRNQTLLKFYDYGPEKSRATASSSSMWFKEGFWYKLFQSEELVPLWQKIS